MKPVQGGKEEKEEAGISGSCGNFVAGLYVVKGAMFTTSLQLVALK